MLRDGGFKCGTFGTVGRFECERFVIGRFAMGHFFMGRSVCAIVHLPYCTVDIHTLDIVKCTIHKISQSNGETTVLHWPLFPCW
jgi:hypothetical protein